MFSHTDWPPRLRGITWSTVSPAPWRPQYWQVQASRASTALRVILRRWTSRGTADVADQADHAGALEDEPLGVERPLAALEDLGALLEHENRGAPNVADVDRLVARVEDQHPAADGDVRRWPFSRWPLAWHSAVAVGAGSPAVRNPLRLRSPGAPEPYVRVGRRVHSATIVDGAPARPSFPGSRWQPPDSCRGSAPTRPSPAAPRSPRRPPARPSAPSRSMKNM